jgi:hypothetical protein
MSSPLIYIITYPITFIMGILLDRFFERRSQLITYYGHISAGKVRIDADSPEIDILTHSIVIRNVGRSPALNVRVGHTISNVANMIAVYPPVAYTIRQIQGTGEEIQFERLLPKASFSITYVYSSSMNFSTINTYVVSDEGIAQKVNMLLNRELPKWFIAVIWVFLVIGAVTTAYYGHMLAQFLIGHMTMFYH